MFFDWWSLMATLPLGSITKLYHCIFEHRTGIFIQPSSDKHDDSFTEHQTQQEIKWFTIRAWAAKLCALLLFIKTNALLPVGRTGETWLVFGEVLLFPVDQPLASLGSLSSIFNLLWDSKHPEATAGKNFAPYHLNQSVKFSMHDEPHLGNDVESSLLFG